MLAVGVGEGGEWVRAKDAVAENTRLNTRCRDLNHELQYRIQQNIELRKAVEAIVDECDCGIRTDQVIEALRGPMAHPDDVNGPK